MAQLKLHTKAGLKRLVLITSALVLALSSFFACVSLAYAANGGKLTPMEESDGGEGDGGTSGGEQPDTGDGDDGGSDDGGSGSDDGGSDDGGTGGDPQKNNTLKVIQITLCVVGTHDKSATITVAGDYIEIWMEMVFEDTSEKSYADYADEVGSDHAGTYYAESSDESVATVDEASATQGQARITARGEGQAEIYIYYTPEGGSDEDKVISREFTVTVPNQTTEYVTRVEILNEDGTEVDSDGVSFYETGEYIQLYVKLYWKNRETGETWTETTNADNEEYVGVTWESDNPTLIYINESTGRMMSQESENGSSAKITVRCYRGEGGKEVTDSIWVFLYGQGGGHYVPAEDLTIRVVYESMPEDYEPESHVFTIDEVISKCGGLQYQAYTYFKGNGAYVTHFAQGVKLYNVLELVEVDIDDVRRWLFSSEINDNYYSPLSYDMLYTQKHYFCWEPELAYESSSSLWKQYSDVTTPLLATSEATISGEYVYDYIKGGSINWDALELNSDVIFRLEVGCTGPTDTKAQSRSVYNVDTITIELKGGPNVTSGTDDNGKGDSDSKGSNGKDKDGTNNTPDSSKTDGTGSGGFGKGGSGNGGTGEGGSGSGQYGLGGGVGSGNDAGMSSNAGAQGGSDDALSATSGAGNTTEEGNQRWQVFQMMNNSESVTDPIDYNNPLEPFALPVSALVLVAGGTTMGVGYRRRLG